MSVDLGGGENRLNLANVANTGTVSNVETLVGGTGVDHITLGSGLTNASIDLGGGGDTLTLSNLATSATVANVATITGGTGTDAITLGSAMVNGSVDLGSGHDTLTLGAYTNHVSVADVQTIMGGAGNDFITVTSGGAAMISGGAGVNQVWGHAAADVFVFDQSAVGNFTTVMNFDQADGNKIGLDISGNSTLTGNAYDVSALTNGVNIEAVATSAARHATTLTTGGHGGFLYEQDTGELYYSANGNFTGGGTLVGVITTDGVTPWTYNFASFQGV